VVQVFYDRVVVVVQAIHDIGKPLDIENDQDLPVSQFCMQAFALQSQNIGSNIRHPKKTGKLHAYQIIFEHQKVLYQV
jgi:hypothetical protein